MNFLKILNKKQNLINNVSDGEFEKCGDVIVAPRHKIFALTCSFCHDVFMDFLDFRNHIIQEHDIYLCWSDTESVSEDEVDEVDAKKEKSANVKENADIEGSKMIKQNHCVAERHETNKKTSNDVSLQEPEETVNAVEIKSQEENNENDADTSTLDLLEDSICQSVASIVDEDNSQISDLPLEMEESFTEITASSCSYKTQQIQILENSVIHEPLEKRNTTINSNDLEVEMDTSKEKEEKQKTSLNDIVQKDSDLQMDIDEDNDDNEIVTETAIATTMSDMELEKEMETVAIETPTEIVKSTIDEKIPEELFSPDSKEINEPKGTDAINDIETKVVAETLNAKVKTTAEISAEAVECDDVENLEIKVITTPEETKKAETEIMPEEMNTSDSNQSMEPKEFETRTDVETQIIELTVKESLSDKIEITAIIPAEDVDPVAVQKLAIKAVTTLEENKTIVDDNPINEHSNETIEIKDNEENTINEIVSEKVNLTTSEDRVSNSVEESVENTSKCTEALHKKIDDATDGELANKNELTADETTVKTTSVDAVTDCAEAEVEIAKNMENETSQKEIFAAEIATNSEVAGVQTIDCTSNNTKASCSKTPRRSRKSEISENVSKSNSKKMSALEMNDRPRNEFTPRRRSVRNICLPKTLMDKTTEPGNNIVTSLICSQSCETLITDDSDMDIDEDLSWKPTDTGLTELETVVEENMTTATDESREIVHLESSLNTTLVPELETVVAVAKSHDISSKTDREATELENEFQIDNQNGEGLDLDHEVAEVEVETNNVLEKNNEMCSERISEIANKDIVEPFHQNQDIVVPNNDTGEVEDNIEREEIQKRTPNSKRLRRKSVKLAEFFEELIGDGVDFEEDEDLKVIQNLVLREEDDSINDEDEEEEEEHDLQKEKDGKNIVEQKKTEEKFVAEEIEVTEEINASGSNGANDVNIESGDETRKNQSSEIIEENITNETENSLHGQEEEIETQENMQTNIDNMSEQNDEQGLNQNGEKRELENKMDNCEFEGAKKIETISYTDTDNHNITTDVGEEESNRIEKTLIQSKKHVKSPPNEDIDTSLSNEENANKNVEMFLRLEDDEETSCKENINEENNKNITVNKINTPIPKRTQRRRAIGKEKTPKTMKNSGYIQSIENEWIENEPSNPSIDEVIKTTATPGKQLPLAELEMNSRTAEVRKRKATKNLEINNKRPKIYETVTEKSQTPVNRSRIQLKTSPPDLSASIKKQLGSSVTVRRTSNVATNSNPTAPTTSVTISEAIPVKILTPNSFSRKVKVVPTQAPLRGNSTGTCRENPVVRIKRLKVQTTEVDTKSLKSVTISKSADKTPTQSQTPLKKPQATSTANTPKKIVEEDDVIDELIQQVSNEDVLATTSKLEVPTDTEAQLFNDEDDDEVILQKVGLKIIADPHCENQMSKAEIKVSQELAKKFANVLENTNLMTKNPNNNNPKHVNDVFISLTEDVNGFLPRNKKLQLIEMKRLVNLVSRLYSHTWQEKTSGRMELINDVMVYLLFFDFIPKTTRRQFYCEFCSLCCVNEVKYEAHRAVHKTPLLAFQCTYCNKFFKLKRTLKVHMDKCKFKQ